ncbi:MAG: anaerobic glycerol-3-phosphate dehydrogenase subunit C [Bifidobacteriaceae bacterium]|jgi:glycerol-3-phosphate dehydrogenase subunit C|nr:anaerobic glycerol-3-phosphate dehydrogenase subunit C [Bifidobacteriaceae bacterium]
MFEPDSYERNYLARASLDHCLKCTICETACPVAAVTPLFAGPKTVGPGAERLRDGQMIDSAVDYCSSCGTCTLVCPQGVKIAELNSVNRAAFKQDHMPLRDQLISRTTLMGKAMTPLAPVANLALRNRPLRRLIEATVGIHHQAALPTAQRHTFRHWLKHHKPSQNSGQRGRLLFFHGCAGQYFEVAAAIAAVEVLEHLGYQVVVPEQGCCGLAKQSNGLYDSARRDVRRLASALAGPPDLPIVTTAASCAGMVKHEAREIMGVSDQAVEQAGRRMRDFSEFLLNLLDDGDLAVQFRPMPLRVTYHAPCQLHGQGIGSPALALLRLIPQLEVVESTAACCGMAGTYGVKKEKYPVAAAVGAALFELVRQTNPALAVCDTETCRWHIAKATGAKVVHPASLIHQALLGQ